MAPFRPQEHPVSLVPAADCVLALPPVVGDPQCGYILDERDLVGFIPLSLPLASLLLMPGALVNATLAGHPFNYTGLRAQSSSHCVVY